MHGTFKDNIRTRSGGVLTRSAFAACFPSKACRILTFALFACGCGVSYAQQNAANSSNLPTDNLQMESRTYYDGAETLGRVGHVAILRRDIFHQIKKFANIQYLTELEKLPDDASDEQKKEMKEAILKGYLNSSDFYSQVLDEHIRLLLFYNDYVVSRPKDQVKEQTEHLVGEFNSKVVPELLNQFHCKNVNELEEYYEKEIESDFEQERRIFVQQQLAVAWMQFNLGEEEFTPTLLDVRRYYEANRDEFKTTAQIRWQSMTVFFGANRSKEDARRKIAHMGNAVQSAPRNSQEAMFAKVCRVDSEDSFASQGGYRVSTERGALKSQQVEDAVFSSDLPVGEMSRIIEDTSSFTIVRVIERKEERIKGFYEVQEEARAKLVAARTEAMKKKYEERLTERFSVEIYALTQADRENFFRSAKKEETSATGRATF